MADRNAPVLRLENVSKEFSGVRVLNDISLDLRPGEIFGVIGENGAGKSTLLKIISGVYQPTCGQVWVDGAELTHFTPQAARRLGVTLIPQEFNLVGDLAVFENIFLGQEKRGAWGLLDKKTMRAASRDLLARLEVCGLDPERRLDRLSAAQKQMVEIAKALVGDRTKVLIMDEPTTVLNRAEVEILFKTMRDLKARGVTVIYVSHKLREVREICDRVLTLRDGEFISLTDAADLTEEQMATGMVGRELTQVFPPKSVPADEMALSVKNLCVPGWLTDVNFDIRRGEVFGLAGLMGAGRTETAEALAGLRRRTGEVTVNGRIIPPADPGAALAAGLSYLSEDRQGKGILVRSGLLENCTLASLGRYVRWGFLDKARRRAAAGRYVAEFSIRAANLSANLEFFSGGNQQKVSLAKCLDTGPKVMIFDEPTRGIDIKAKSDIYNFIQSLAAEGLACLLISSELEEIIGLCHRAAVLHEGRVTGVLTGEHINEEEIMLHATAVKNGPAACAPGEVRP